MHRVYIPVGPKCHEKYVKNTVCQVLEYLTKIALSYGDLWGLAMETYGLWDRFAAGTGLLRHTCTGTGSSRRAQN